MLLTWRRAWRSWSAGALSALAAACGARTEPMRFDAGVCTSALDCQDDSVCNGAEVCRDGLCHRGESLVCDDGDPCTDDDCEEAGDTFVGGCVAVDRRVDADDDLHFAVIPGRPSCGDDCDDDDAMVHPGADDRCNAADDDCDGAVDEGALFTPERRETRLTFGDAASQAFGLATPVSSPTAPPARDVPAWAVTFGRYERGAADLYFLGLDELGRPLDEPFLLTPEPGDAFGGALAFDGEAYGMVFHDRRSGDFELYFNRLTLDGQKLGPDVRLTDAPGFSIAETIVFTGGEYAIAFQDGRHELEGPGNQEVYLAFVSVDGFEIEDERRLTTTSAASESPALVHTGDRLGVAYVETPFGGSPEVRFLATDLLGEVVLPSMALSSPRERAMEPTAVAIGSIVFVAWESTAGGAPSRVVVAAVDVETGDVFGPRAVGPDDGAFERFPRLIALGDRAGLVYATDRPSGDAFSLWGAVITRDLEITPSVTVAGALNADAVEPVLARGQTSIGVAFEDARNGTWDVYFSRLVCADDLGATEP